MNIEQEIQGWDGKSSGDIGAIYARYANEDCFVENLVELYGRKNLEKGVTWLLKCHLEKKHSLSTDTIAVIYRFALKLESWEAKLHVLQSMSYMPVGETEKNSVEFFLRNCLMDTNKFVRAWAYNGFYEISFQYPEFKDETKKFLEMAMKDEAPSVKARIRNIMKSGF